MFKKCFILLFACCFTIGLLYAEEYRYPSAEEPVFSITFPDNWIVDAEGNLLHAGPPDRSIYLGLWALEEAESIKAAVESLDEAITDLVTEVQWEDPEEMSINEIPFLTIAGVGQAEGEQEVTVEVAIFSPDGEQLFLLLYFGVPEAEEKYDADLMDIVQSICGVYVEEENQEE